MFTTFFTIRPFLIDFLPPCLPPSLRTLQQQKIHFNDTHGGRISQNHKIEVDEDGTRANPPKRTTKQPTITNDVVVTYILKVKSGYYKLFFAIGGS